MNARRPRRWLFALSAVALAATLGAGCTSSYSNLTGARALDAGEFQGGIGAQVPIHTNVATTAAASLGELNETIQDTGSDEEISEATLRNYLDFAIAYALFRPGMTPEAFARVGVADNLDVGARYNGSMLKGSARWGFWETDDEDHVASVSLGVGRQSSLAPGAIEYLTQTEWTRWDGDLQVLYGYRWPDYFEFYIGPRFIYSYVSTNPKIDGYLLERIPDDVRAEFDFSQYFPSEHILYGGLTTGMKAGYKHIYLTLELTAMYMSFEPMILDEERDLSGMLINPAGAVVFEF